MVNAAAMDDRYLYIAVTNEDTVCRMDIHDGKAILTERLERFLRVPSPNGIVVRGKKLFVASIPKDYGTLTKENVLYRVRDIFLAHPKLEICYNVPGLYDGLALSKDGRVLSCSDWQTASVGAINLERGIHSILYQEKGIEPGNMAVHEDTLWIPDLMHDCVIIITLASDR